MCATSLAGLDANQTSRTFVATLKLKGPFLTKIDIALNCRAPVGAFVLLEKEGSTYVHTTVMANCVAVVTRDQKTQQFTSHGTNLMEAKE